MLELPARPEDVQFVQNTGPYLAALAVAERSEMMGNFLVELPNATTAHVYADGETDLESRGLHPELAAEYVIRLAPIGPDPQAQLLEARNHQLLIDKARAAGASVQVFVGEPVIQGNFLATTSEYLPHKISGYKVYGQTLAGLHLAGEKDRLAYEAAPFDPLASTEILLSKLCMSQEALSAGGETLPSDILPLLGSYVEDGQESVKEIMHLDAERGRPLSLLHHDINIGNILADAEGNAVLIDLDGVHSGPAEYDFARPEGHWRRFGRPAHYLEDFRQGYLETVNRDLDPKILKIGMWIADIRYSASMLRIAQSTVKDEQTRAWAIQEGTQRIRNLRDPDFPWHSITKRA